MVQNKTMYEIYNKNKAKAKEIVAASDSQIDLILNKQFELMNRIIKEFGYSSQNDRKLLLNTMMLSILDEWFEADFEIHKELCVDFDFEFEMIDMLHFIIQIGYLVLIENSNLSFNDTNIIKDFKVKALNDFDKIDDFINYNKQFFNTYYEPYQDTIDKKISFKNIIKSLQYLLENVHWKTWKRYKKYTEEEINNIMNYLKSLFFSILNIIELSGTGVAELYVIKNIENFDRQDRRY